MTLRWGPRHGLVQGWRDRGPEKHPPPETSQSPPATTLYAWAGEILSQLKQRNGTTPPKLVLAEALGITRDPSWRGGNRGGPVEPRHRVLARFAREGRFDSIWSLNWDCLLENALERVGLDRHKASTALPWKTRYSTFITVRDYRVAGGPCSVTVFKPHGCVRSLDEARAAVDRGEVEEARRLSDRFLITADELKTPRFDRQATQQHIFWNLMTSLARLPLISLGWSASEEYICKLVEEGVQPVLRERTPKADELSIIDIDFNPEGHRRLATAHGRTQAEAHVPVDSGPRGFTLDALWLWLQALYTVQYLHRYHPERTQLSVAFESLEKPRGADWLLWWADERFPAWCRLCWRAGIVRCLASGRRVPPESLDIDGDDAHVPIDIPNCERPDLIAAGDVLATLWDKQPQWDFQRFPGALFEAATGRLVLPVPTWASPVAHSDQALIPLVRLWKNGPLSSVQDVAVFGLEGNQAPISEAIEHWRQSLARALNLPHFTSSESIRLTNPTQL